MGKRDLFIIVAGIVALPLFCCGCFICSILFVTALPRIEDSAVESISLSIRSTSVFTDNVTTPTPVTSVQNHESTDDVEAIHTTITPLVEIPTSTSTSTATATSVLPTETAAPSPTIVSKPALIPGLHPNNMFTLLRDRGLQCSDEDKGVLYFSRICSHEEDDFLLIVEYYGRTQQIVDHVEGVVIQLGSANDDLSSELLGFLAAIPYYGSEPDNAQHWIEESLSKLNEEGDV